ncbi:MAG: hypothetical protein JNL63_08060, partial [Bacteroidia bacterium]|nr:hypothetical protein [Bacteroidia bacterium]
MAGFNFNAVISKNMIKAIPATLMLLFISNTFANGTKSIDPELKEKTGKWMSRQKPIGFRENKGQMVGIDNKAASFVLFKAEVPNLNIWVTTTGLTYQFFKMEEGAPSGSPVGGEHRSEGEDKEASTTLSLTKEQEQESGA